MDGLIDLASTVIPSSTNCLLICISHCEPSPDVHLEMADSPAAVAGDKDQPEIHNHGDDQDKNESAGSVPTRKPTMADYFRVFSYATKWDFFIYAMACFASIGGGATMPLSKQIPDPTSTYPRNFPSMACSSKPPPELQLFAEVLSASWPALHNYIGIRLQSSNY